MAPFRHHVRGLPVRDVVEQRRNRDHERVGRRDLACARASVEAPRLVTVVSTRTPFEDPSAVAIRTSRCSHIDILRANYDLATRRGDGGVEAHAKPARG